MTAPLAAVAHWPGTAAAAWLSPTTAEQVGPGRQVFEWASVTKVLSSLAVWIATEEETVSFDDPCGPSGSTVAHLLAHASGLSPDGDEVLCPPATRRIYSNRGIEVAAEHVAARAGMGFAEYARQAVLEPLGMEGVTLGGSPAHGARGCLEDLMRLTGELLSPTLVSIATHEQVVTTAFPGLAGILPGFGRQDPNDWGLGVEIRAGKSPHWTGALNSPATFGHFGRSGSFLWVDPVRSVAACSLSSELFGPWAMSAWPELSDAVISAL